MKIFLIVLLLVQAIVFAKTLDSEGLPVSELKFPRDKNEVQLPLLSGRGLYFTDAVSINGTPVGVFLIDTASNISILDKEFAEDAGLSRTLEGMSDVVGKKKYRFLRIKKLNVGAIEINNHLIYTQEITKYYRGFKKPIVGIIGGDILGKMPFALDFGGKSLTFYKNASFLPTGKSIPLKIKHRLRGLGIFSKANEFSGVPQVNVIINKYSVIPLVMDSGNSDFINLRANVALSNTALAGRYRLPRILAESGGTQQYNALIKQAEIGDYKVEPAGRSYIIFPHVKNSPAESTFGTGFLQNFRLTFDYSQGRMWISKSDNKKFGEIDFGGHTQLARALSTGDLSQIKQVLVAGAERYFKGLRGENYLIMAVQGSEPFSVDLLLKYGKRDINFFDNLGRSALMHAALRNEFMMVNTLLDGGAIWNNVDVNGMNALHYAAAGGSLVVVDAFIRRKYSLNTSSDSGMRALSFAAADGNSKVFKVLLEADAEYNYLDKAANTLWHMAVMGNNPQVITAVANLADGASIDTPNKSGETPLILAVKSKNLLAAEELIRLGANVRAMNSKTFKSALSLALESKNEQLIKIVEKALLVEK